MFMLKHSVKLRRYLLCRCVTAYHGMACVLHAVQNATESHSAHAHDDGRRLKYVGAIFMCILTH